MSLPLTSGASDELRAGRAVEHVDVHVRHRPEAAALDEYRLLVEHLGGLKDLALLAEHDGVREAVLDQEERHQAVVHVREGGPREAQHVDLDPVHAEVVAQGLDQLREVLAVVEGPVDEVDPDDAQGLLLEHGLLVPHPHVEHDLAWLALRLGLEPEAQPAVGLVGPLVVARGHRVREHEEVGAVAARRREPLDEELILVVEHELQPLAGDVPRGLAVDRVAEDHVIGGDRLRDGPRSASRLEEFPRDLLAGADLRKRAVLGSVEVDGEGLLPRGKEFLLLGHASNIGLRGKGCNPFLCHDPATADSTGGRAESGYG